MTHRYTRYLVRFVALVAVCALVAGCAASRASGRGESAARGGDWDAAVEHFRRAVQEDPERVEYQIALERAMINASIQHLDQARLLEAREQLEDALREYRRASQYDPSNRQIAATFLQQVDAAAGRIDIAAVRPDDPTRVAGTGLLSAILFDAVGGGPANMTVTGSATGPSGAPVPLVFGATPWVTVR